MAKCCCLDDLSVSDLAREVGAEFSTITLWGGRGREGSRTIQLLMAIYFLFLYSPILICVIYDNTLLNDALLSFNVSLSENPNLLGGPHIYDKVLFKNCAVIFIFAGFVSFMLFCYQIYFMEKYNTLAKLRTLSRINNNYC